MVGMLLGVVWQNLWWFLLWIMFYLFRVVFMLGVCMVFMLVFSSLVWLSLFRMFMMFLVWCMFFMCMLFLVGVILYSIGICCESWLMFCMVKFILVLCVVVSRCSIVLVELFIEMLRVMVFLKVLQVVILCGSMFLLLFLQQCLVRFMIRCLVCLNRFWWLEWVVSIELLFGSERFSVFVRQFIELVVNMFEYELQVGQVECFISLMFFLFMLLLVVIIIVFIRFSVCLLLLSLILFVFIGLFEMNMVGILRCSVVISMLGVILLQLEM